MMKDNTKILNYIFFGFLLFFTLLSQCNAGKSKENTIKNSIKLDSIIQIINTLEPNPVTVDGVEYIVKRQNLKSEQRTILNINQIFLTKKRPDERIIEINKELEELEKTQEINE